MSSILSSVWKPSFKKEEFLKAVLNPAFTRLSEHKARDAIHDAVDHLGGLNLAQKQQGADLVAAKFRQCSLTDLEALVECLLSHTFVVEHLGIVEKNDNLLRAFTDICIHVLDRHHVGSFVQKLREATGNKAISIKSCESLFTMAFSKRETVWKRQRTLPVHHSYTLTHALILLCFNTALNDRRSSSIAVLESWLVEATASLFLPRHATDVDSLLNVERIVRVLGALDILSNEQFGALLNIIVRYTVLIASLQRKTSYYEVLDSAARIRSTANSVSAAFGCLLASHVFMPFLVDLPGNVSKGFLDSVVNEVLSPSILRDAATMVCSTVLNLNHSGHAALAESLLSTLVRKVSVINATSSLKQQVWEAIYGNTNMHAVLQAAVITELQDPRGVILVDSLPHNVLVSICEKSSYRQISSVMARLFTNIGSSLLIAVKDNLLNPLRAMDSVSMCEQLLLQHFRPQLDGNTDVDRFLEPIVWVVAGINAQVSAARTQYAGAFRDAVQAVPWCFFFLLRIYLHNIQLSMLTGDEGRFPLVWWSKVSQALSKKIFDNPSLQYMFQQSLMTFTSSSKSGLFYGLGELEGGKDFVDSALPAMYVTFSAALGEALHRYTICKYSGSYASSAREHIITNCIEKSIELLPVKPAVSRQIGICHSSYSFVKASLDGLLLFLREEKFVIPSCLVGLFDALRRIDVVDLHQHVAQYLEDIMELQFAIKDHLSKTVNAIHDADLSERDLDTLAKHIDSIISICKSLNIQPQKLSMLSAADIMDNYQIALQETKELSRVILFLHQRNLCPQYLELRNLLDQNISNSVTVKGMQDSIISVVTKLGLNDFNVLRALRAFAGNSDLFVHHFGKVDTKITFSETEAKLEVINRTKHALDNLSLLVSNESIRIEDFFASDIAELVSELQRTGQGHSHRQRKMERELEAIAQFFGSEKDSHGLAVGMLESSLDRLNARLNAAFHLVKLKEILPSFLSAMKELKLAHLLDETTSATLSLLLAELSDNFFIKDGPDIQSRLHAALSGLRQIDLVIISKLASELSAGLMLQVFARFSDENVFEQALEHAQNQASGNPVAGKLLLKLRGLRAVLRPFWNPSCTVTLQALAEHMVKEVRVINTQGSEALCPILEELTNVIEHWPECEICFRDGGSSSAGFGDIARLVQVYRRSGRFISSLSAHPGGSCLSFKYSDKNGCQVFLSPQVLQERVQWAVLGASGGEDDVHESSNDDQKSLDEFIIAFQLAEKLHSLCLQLEALGHPDFQSLSCDQNMPLAPSCDCGVLQHHLNISKTKLEDWALNVELGCKNCPRLCMLSQRSRVHFFLALRSLSSSGMRVSLSYVLQCFPSHASNRCALEKASFTALTMFQDKGTIFSSDDDWNRAFVLLRNMETALDCQHEESAGLNYSIVRYELLGLSSFEVYCTFLNLNITENCGIVNSPAAVLWCCQESTSEHIQDFLSVACSGVSGSVYAIAINNLLPRIREELLRGLQNENIRSQVVLIFTDQDGLDACQHYRLESYSNNLRSHKYIDSYRQAMWPFFSRPPIERKDESSELSVYVVGGPAGSGKSFWVNRKVSRIDTSLKLTLVLHEGFTIHDVIDQIEMGFDNEDSLLALHLVITTVTNLPLLNVFLHNLLFGGLIYDPKTGKSFAFMNRIKLELYVELPSLSGTDTVSAWPGEGDTWQTKDHPFLAHLSCLQVCVFDDHFISIRTSDHFYADNTKAQFVAACLHVYRSNNNNVDVASLPLHDDDLLEIFEPDDFSDILTTFFDGREFSSSKKCRCSAILVLYDKFRVIASLQHKMNAEMDKSGLEEVYFAKYWGKVTAYFELALYEAFCIASEGRCLDSSSVHLIVPSWDDEDDEFPVEALLDVLVINHTAGITAQALSGLTVDMPLHTLIAPFNEVLPRELANLRSMIAPLFGMRDSALMCCNLVDSGHLLTAESLAGVLHLHGRRTIGANVLYEGETGCGKTQTLKLYSNLINANTSLFTNLKFHMLAVLRIIVSDALSSHSLNDDEEFTSEDVEAFESAGRRIINLDAVSASMTKLVQLTMEWLALGPFDLANSVGSFICAYFFLVFRQFPLYSEGFDALIKAKFKECCAWISTHEDFKIQVLDICSRAAHSHFLLGVGTISDGLLESIVWLDSSVELDYVQDSAEFDLFSNGDDLKLFMQGLLTCKPSSLYYRLLADEGLTAHKWRDFITEVSLAADRVSSLCESAVVCVFIDECNTAGAFGIVCEAFSWHSLDGRPLPSNLFLVGAINPYRSTSLAMPAMQFTTSNISVSYQKDAAVEDSHDYLAHIPYIVKSLPPSMESIVTRYPNLSQLAEVMFLREYIQQHITISAPTVIDESKWEQLVQQEEYKNFVIHLVSSAQNIVRNFRIPRLYMSIRNLIRTVQLLDWYLDFQVLTNSLDSDVHENIFLPKVNNTSNMSASAHKRLVMKHSVIMAVTLSYMLQLPSEGHVAAGKVLEDFRRRFLRELAGSCIGANNTWVNEVCGNADRRFDNFVQTWMGVVKGSLAHLWSFARTPKGLAKTDAVMEVFYANIAAAENRMSLLVSGPPGCGKTLSFNLACENLSGPSHQHTLAFQHLKKASKFMYQCSRSSTGAEIASRFIEAKEHQKDLDSRQPGKHICIVGLDEAGLPPENRQVLKSIHDDLEARQVAAVMMSNTILDAAKTSRMLLVMQTQTNLIDLTQLAEGLLIDDDDKHSSPSAVVKGWQGTVHGLCRAFFTISEVIKTNNWFHSRDFVYLCRLLRRFIDESPPVASLFDAKMLIRSLRRNMQPLDSSLFGALANHFLVHCGIDTFSSNFDIVPSVTDSLIDAVNDNISNVSDSATAHCRYAMIVDPTDCESAIDLVFGMNILNAATTNVVSVSDFPGDATPTKHTAVLGHIKRAIEAGVCLLLKNSSSLQSALYDVINRHYKVSVKEDPSNPGHMIREAYANIALGSFSRYVKVHPNFRLIVHVPASQLGSTPLPFLNRLEKYPLSIKSALDKRVAEIALNPPSCLRALNSKEQCWSFFQSIQLGAEDFVQKMGGSSSFYGFVLDEVIPAWVLRSVSAEVLQSQLYFRHEPSLISKVLSIFHEKNESATPAYLEDFEDNSNRDLNGGTDGSIGFQLKSIIRQVNFQLLNTARLDVIFRLRKKLPACYITEYIDNQEHLTCTSLLRKLAWWSFGGCSLITTQTPLKLITYTRTDSDILRLSTSESLKALCRHIGDVGLAENSGFQATALLEDDRETVENLPLIGGPVIVVLQLSSYSSEQSCERSIQSAMRTISGPRLVLIVADMKTCTSNQVTMVRRMVDFQFSIIRQKKAEGRVGDEQGTFMPTVLFLLHCASSMLHLRPCYQSVPLNDWEAIYVDSFSHVSLDDIESFNCDLSSKPDDNDAKEESKESNAPAPRNTYLDAGWLREAFGICQLHERTKAYREFGIAIRGALEDVVNSCSFRQTSRRLRGKILRLDKFLHEVGVKVSLPAYHDNNKAWVYELITSRPYIERTLMEAFAILWRKMVEQRVEEGCARVLSGATTLGLVSDIKASQKWLLSDFLRLVIARDLSSDLSLEAVANLSTDVPTDQWEYLVDLEPKDFVENLATQDFVTSSIALASLAVVTLRSSILIYSHNMFGRDYSFKADRASLIPLFGSLVNQVREILPVALTASRKKGKWTAQTVLDEAHIRKLLVTSENYKDLGRAIAIIEHKEDVWRRFQLDFVAIILGFCNYHGDEELSLLVTAAEAVPSLQVGSMHFADANVSRQNFLKWILHKQQIKGELTGISRLLCSTRNFVSPVKLAHALSSDSSCSLADMKCLILSEFSVGLWNTFQELLKNNFPEGDALRDWTNAMRDHLHLDILSPKSRALCNGSPEKVGSFAVILMVLCFKMGTSGWCKYPSFILESVSETNDSVVGHIVCNGNIQISSGDVLRSALALLSSVAHGGLSRPVSDLVVESILWILQEPAVYTSSDYSVPFVASVLSIEYSLPNLSQTFEDSLDATLLLQGLTLGARSEILRRLLLIDRNKTESIVVSLAGSIGQPDTVLVPSLALSTMTTFTTANLLSFGDVAPYHCHSSLEFAEKVLTHSLHVELLLTDFSNDTKECIRRFQQLASNKATNFFQRLSCGVFSLHILELVSEFLARGEAFKSPLASLQRGNMLTALVQIISICPCAMGLFFLSRFDMTISLSLLQDSAFLQALGLSWLQITPVETLPSESTGETVAAYVAVTKSNQTKITSVYFAQIALNHAMQCQFWKIPTLNELLNSSCVIEDGLQEKCKKFCQHLLDFERQDSLEANNHFSSVLQLHNFAREKFAYCFADADEARMLPFDQALTVLSVEERLQGRKLLATFIEAWNHLRNIFVTFVICAREVGAAAEIPILTDSKGDRPVLLGDIVELGDSSEHESLPARMLEQRLLKTINDILSNDPVVLSLRSDMQFNPKEAIVAVDASDDFLSEISLNCRVSPPQLLTGIRTDVSGQQHLESLLVSHSSWEGELLVLPSALPEKPTVDWKVLLEETRVRVAIEAQQMAHNASFIICPRCNMLSERITGCENLTCGSPDDPYGDKATARGNSVGDLGCGMRLHAINHRVPPPGNAPLPVFLPTRAPIDLAKLPSAVPAPPAVHHPTGGRVVDFVPVARYLFARVFVGRVRINVDNGFFSPLPFRFSSSKDQSNVAKEDKTAELKESEGTDQSPPPQEAFARLRFATNQLDSALSGSVSVPLDNHKSERIKNIAGRLGEIALATQCSALASLIANVQMLVKERKEELGNAVDFARLDCQELVEERMLQTLSPLLLPLTVGELIVAGNIFADVGSESGGVVYPPSLSVDIPRAERENCKSILSEVRNMLREEREKVMAELKDFGGMLAQMESSLLLCPSNVLLCHVPSLSGFLAGKLMCQRLLGGLKVCHWGGMMKWVRKLIGEITLSLMNDCSSGETANVKEGTINPDSNKLEEGDVYQELIPPNWLWQAESNKEVTKDDDNEIEEGVVMEEPENYYFEEEYLPQADGRAEDLKPRGLWDAAVDSTRRTVFPSTDQDVKVPDEVTSDSDESLMEAIPPPPTPTYPINTSDQTQKPGGLLSQDPSPATAPVLPPRPPTVMEWGAKVAWKFLSFWRTRLPALEETIANLEIQGLSGPEELRYLDNDQYQEIAAILPLVPCRMFYWALRIQNLEGGFGQVDQFASPVVVMEMLQSSPPPAVVSSLKNYGVLLDVSVDDQPHDIIEQLGILTREELDGIASSFPLLRARKFKQALWGKW